MISSKYLRISQQAGASTKSRTMSGTESTSANGTNMTSPDVTSIMAQIAKLEQHNESLKSELSTKSQEIGKLSEKKRQEMKCVYDSLMSKWVDTLDTTKPEARDLFKNGLLGIADRTEDENGIWQVVMCASANAAKKEEDFQKLQSDYNTLMKKSEGGQFSHEEDRVGGKRSAPGPPELEAGKPANDVWSQFESYMKQEFKPEYVR
jgi:hypothetical protein